MQATIEIKCRHCLTWLGSIDIDTADMPDKLQERINNKILTHRQDCFYYRYQDNQRHIGDDPPSPCDNCPDPNNCQKCAYD